MTDTQALKTKTPKTPLTPEARAQRVQERKQKREAQQLAQEAEEKRLQEAFEQERELVWLRLFHDAVVLREIMKNEPELTDSMSWWVDDFDLVILPDESRIFFGYRNSAITRSSMTRYQAKEAKQFLETGFECVKDFREKKEAERKEAERRAALRQTALSKLTPEEREALGHRF